MFHFEEYSGNRLVNVFHKENEQQKNIFYITKQYILDVTKKV